MESEELRVTTSLKIKPSIRNKFKVYCIKKKIDMSELLEKLIENEMERRCIKRTVTIDETVKEVKNGR